MRMSRIVKLAAVAAAAPVLALTFTTSASAASLGSSLPRGNTMWGGDYIASSDLEFSHQYVLTMQTDGNLVEYISHDNSGGGPWQVCWASNTYNSGGTHATYQSDGNFVIYDDYGNPKWASNTQWKAGSTVDINAYGKVYVGQTPITGSCGWQY